MASDSREIAERLVQEHGRERAEEIATDSVFEAQQSGSNYDLSIWREVKRVLRDMKTELKGTMMSQDKRNLIRRDEEENRRNLSKKLFPDETITHEDVGFKEDRREDARRSEQDRRGSDGEASEEA